MTNLSAVNFSKRSLEIVKPNGLKCQPYITVVKNSFSRGSIFEALPFFFYQRKCCIFDTLFSFFKKYPVFMNIFNIHFMQNIVTKLSDLFVQHIGREVKSIKQGFRHN